MVLFKTKRTSLIFIVLLRLQKKLNPKLLFVSAMGPIVVVIVGCLVAKFGDASKLGIATVSHLNLQS